MSGKRNGPNSHLSRLRDLLGQEVYVNITDPASVHVKGLLQFGKNYSSLRGFKEESPTSVETQSQNTGYYVIGNDCPPLRIYVREIESIQEKEEDSPSIKIRPTSRPKRVEHGFNYFWLESVYNVL